MISISLWKTKSGGQWPRPALSALTFKVYFALSVLSRLPQKDTDSRRTGASDKQIKNEQQEAKCLAENAKYGAEVKA